MKFFIYSRHLLCLTSPTTEFTFQRNWISGMKQRICVHRKEGTYCEGATFICLLRPVFVPEQQLLLNSVQGTPQLETWNFSFKFYPRYTVGANKNTNLNFTSYLFDSQQKYNTWYDLLQKLQLNKSNWQKHNCCCIWYKNSCITLSFPT